MMMCEHHRLPEINYLADRLLKQFYDPPFTGEKRLFTDWVGVEQNVVQITATCKSARLDNKFTCAFSIIKRLKSTA